MDVMKLLVTGGAGFIGSNFVRKNINNPDFESITVLDSLTYAGNLKNLSDVMNSNKFIFIQGDICDLEIVSGVTKGIDVIINFAAESHVDRSIINPSQFLKTNVFGTQNLLQAALINKVGRFIQISTDEVYGSIKEGSWTEDWPLSPNSPYSASKASADLLVLSYYKTFGLNVSITRCSNNYGPYQFPEKIIPLFVTNLLKNKKLPVYGNGKNIRDWIHVDDHCAGIEKTVRLGQPGEIYNFGGGNEITNIELANKILDCFHLSSDEIEYVQDRKGHDLRYSVSFDKALNKLGWKPTKDFTDGLLETIEWYKSNAKWWENLKN
jgi:dTDP-glucose 4,6-dehydratase